MRLVGDMEAFLDVVAGPIAIRSSSLLEDSHYQPFAGVYSTYMIPSAPDRYERLSMLSEAILSSISESMPSACSFETIIHSEPGSVMAMPCCLAG